MSGSQPSLQPRHRVPVAAKCLPQLRVRGHAGPGQQRQRRRLRSAVTGVIKMNRRVSEKDGTLTVTLEETESFAEGSAELRLQLDQMRLGDGQRSVVHADSIAWIRAKCTTIYQTLSTRSCLDL